VQKTRHNKKITNKGFWSYMISHFMYYMLGE
jgi:hypothetical protein